MKSTLLIIIVLFVFSCKNSESNPPPRAEAKKPALVDSNTVFLTDTALYEFMNLIMDRIISDSNLLGSSPIFIDINNCGFSFGKGTPSNKNFKASRDDSIAIVNQLNITKNKKWIANKLRQFSLETKYSGQYWDEHGRFDWEKFKREGNKCFIDLSIPIFNFNRTKAVIKTSFSCEGAASGLTYWLEKKGNGWTVCRWGEDWIT